MKERATLMGKGDAIRPEIEQGELHQKVVDQVVLAYLIRLTYLENVAAKMGVTDNTDHREAEAIAQLPEQAFSARGWGAGDLKAALRATRLSQLLAIQDLARAQSLEIVGLLQAPGRSDDVVALPTFRRLPAS